MDLRRFLIQQYVKGQTCVLILRPWMLIPVKILHSHTVIIYPGQRLRKRVVVLQLTEPFAGVPVLEIRAPTFLL